MNAIDEVQLLAELSTDFCELNHGPNTERKDFPASDYIVLPMGYQEDSVTEVTVREMVIPVCFDCAQALSGNDWVLLYCIECNCSHWIYRKFSKLDYRHQILWLRGCPECADELHGLYFNDFPTIKDTPVFLSHQRASNAA